LKEVTVNVAREIVKFKGNVLHLSGLKSIAPEVASELAKFKGENLYLNGLKTISAEVAKALSSYRFFLYLDGLETSSSDVAYELFNSDALHICLRELDCESRDLCSYVESSTKSKSDRSKYCNSSIFYYSKKHEYRNYTSDYACCTGGVYRG